MDLRWVGLGISLLFVVLWIVAYKLPNGEWATTLVLVLALFQLVVGYQTGSYFNRLRQLAYHDSLTGVLVNRRFQEKLQKEVALARKENSTVTLLFIDLDNFKQFNDKHGHIEGDKLLQRFAEVLLSCVRKQDTVGRWGGEEFVVILPRAETRTGLAVGERIRASVREQLSGVTVSIGVASYPAHASRADELTELADSMMYEAKKQKDCILAPPVGTEK